MSIIPNPTPSSIAAILNLVQSPRVQYGIGQIKRSIPYIGGPMSTQSPKLPQSRSRLGASPSVGQWYENKGDTFGSTIGEAVSGLLGQQQFQQDPLMALYEQLLGQLQKPVNMPTGINTQDLMNQVRKALDPIYNQRAASAKTQGAQGQKDIQGMYQALADDYKKLAPQQVAQAADAQKQIEQLYGQLRSNIEGSYARVSGEQADEFKQLGIEAALPDVLADQQAAVTDATTAASQNQAQQQQRYMDIGQMDSTYYREGSPNAIMAGNEYASNLAADLQDYLQQVEAERSSGIQTAYMDQLSQAQNQLLQQQQMAQGEAGRRQEMLWQMLQSQLQGRQQGVQQLNPSTFMSQLPEEVQQSVANAFTQLQRSPEAIYGKVEDKRSPVPGTFVETKPEWFMAQADEMLRRGQIDEETHQALLMYMQLYYGMGK